MTASEYILGSCIDSSTHIIHNTFWSCTFWGPGPWKERCIYIGPNVPFKVPIYGIPGTVLFRVLDFQGSILLYPPSHEKLVGFFENTTSHHILNTMRISHLEHLNPRRWAAGVQLPQKRRGAERKVLRHHSLNFVQSSLVCLVFSESYTPWN